MTLKKKSKITKDIAARLGEDNNDIVPMSAGGMLRSSLLAPNTLLMAYHTNSCKA